MKNKYLPEHIRYTTLLLSLLACGLLAAIGLIRLDVDTDVISSLPRTDGVLSDALDIFANHPMLEQIAINLGSKSAEPDLLVDCAEFIEEQLQASGLFTQVGSKAFGEHIPELALYAARYLPILFDRHELEQQVAPRLAPDAISKRMTELYTGLNSMESIGQAQFIGSDPLALKDLVLARMALLAPTLSGRMYRNQLLSGNNQHLLVTAHPLGTGTDTTTARALSRLFDDIAQKVEQRFPAITMTPVGAFRAALDNETIIRHDVNMALLLAMAGIGLLLTVSFSRPVIGLLSLVPALAGTGIALFVYSLLSSTISIMVLGFGGAVISITVDHGIAFLLFLDRPHTTSGKEAATEVRAVGMMAVLTTIGAFLTLSFSGFPLFTQLGSFTALGVLFSFLYVHTILPRVLPVLPAGSQQRKPLQTLADRLAGTGWPGAVFAVLLALAMLVTGAPSFDVSLESMNTVSKRTLDADKVFSAAWGSMDNRIFLMTQGKTIAELLRHDRQLTAAIHTDRQNGMLQAAFISSMFFPDRVTARQHFDDWQQFWTTERIAGFTRNLANSSMPLGFSAEAFTPFLTMLKAGMPPVPTIPEKFFPLVGISSQHRQQGFVRFVTFVPGTEYNGADFFKKYQSYGKVYDPGFFSHQLGTMLFSTFAKILLIVGSGITLMLLLSSLSLPLTLITLLPVGFAYVCTLGTLNLLGRSLDIPSLMLSIVILGMGVDYSIFFVRAHQRFRDPAHPSYGLVRMTVFMAGASTLIGFGVLATARHTLLHSIGITCLLGIGFSLLGAFLLLPPILQWYFATSPSCRATDLSGKALCRFHLLEAYPRMFARFKLKYDPLFTDLTGYLPAPEKVKHIIDIGCGYGVPAAWCLEYFPTATITALDPDSERVRIAAMVIGKRGKAFTGWATDLQDDEKKADLILLLDMLHYIDDKGLEKLFTCCALLARPDASLVIRYTIQPPGTTSLLWHLEQARIRLQKMQGYYRSPEQIESIITAAGFLPSVHTISTINQELCWLVATPK
jgi:predicted exporter/SAM-dependent methyltransferase